MGSSENAPDFAPLSGATPVFPGVFGDSSRPVPAILITPGRDMRLQGFRFLGYASSQDGVAYTKSAPKSALVWGQRGVCIVVPRANIAAATGFPGLFVCQFHRKVLVCSCGYPLEGDPIMAKLKHFLILANSVKHWPSAKARIIWTAFSHWARQGWKGGVLDLCGGAG